MREWGFQLYKMKRVMEMDGSDGCTTLWVHLIPLNCILRNDLNDNFALCTVCHNKKNIGKKRGNWRGI